MLPLSDPMVAVWQPLAAGLGSLAVAAVLGALAVVWLVARTRGPAPRGQATVTPFRGRLREAA
jgi:hypothetical protein